MIPPGAETVLVRHSELGTKSSQVQHRMERRLGGNLEQMLAFRGIDGIVRREHGRLYIETTPDAIEAATNVATDTFGVISASPAITTKPTMDAMTHTLATVAEAVHEGGSFAVRGRRAGNPDEHPFTSQEIEREGGSAIWEVLETRGEPTVDLSNPDQTYFVECRADRAYVFAEKRPGPGGFPYGSQGRVIALVSGGIDSPVAAWEMMRRGCEIVVLYFDFEAYGGPDHVARAIESVRHLSRFTPDGTLTCYRAPAGRVAELLVEETGATRMLSLRRFMFSAAETLADQVRAHSIATGESLGQKSSQTGHNLGVTSNHLRYPIHRPLLGHDKQTIINRAKRLGTYEEARIDAGCNRIAPTHPATAATLADILADEPDGFLRLADAMIADAERLEVNDRRERPIPVDAKGQP